MNRKTATGTRILSQGLALSALFGAASVGHAVLLNSGNSSMNIDPMSSNGVDSWTVEGQNQLFKQWFWYRVGSSGPELSVDTIGAPTVVTTANSATFTYSGAEFDVSITYLLSGNTWGTGQANLNEDIAIVNKVGGASTLDFHIFQYSDFNLEGTPGGDNVLLYPSSSPFALAYQWENDTGLSESIVSNNPMANRGEVGITPTVLNKLTNLGADDLSNAAGPIGPDDVSFAFQWDFSIADGDTKTISKLKNLNINVIPEPTTGSLGLLGLALLAARRRNWNRSIGSVES